MVGKGDRQEYKGEKIKVKGARRMANGIDVGDLRLEIGGALSSSDLLIFSPSPLPNFPASVFCPVSYVL